VVFAVFETRHIMVRIRISEAGCVFAAAVSAASPLLCEMKIAPHGGTALALY
jgi:hypothetical protein